MPDAPAPPRLTRDELFRLPAEDRVAYDRWRNEHHANLGPFKTPQSMALRRLANSILRSNQQDATRVRSSFSVDGPSGTGKTTTVKLIARDLWREEIKRGPTADGEMRVPVVRISLKGTNTTRDIDEALARAYINSSSRRRRSTAPPLDRFIEFALSSETRLFILDDFNHLELEAADQVIRIGNHLKGISEEVTGTLAVVGAGVNKLPFLDKENANASYSLSQTTRRWFPLSMAPMQVNSERARTQWLGLLVTIDNAIVLADHVPGTLPHLAQMLFNRTQGHLQSLFDLITQATSAAIADGSEQLVPERLAAMPMTVGALAGFDKIKGAAANRTRRHEREAAQGVASNASA